MGKEINRTSRDFTLMMVVSFINLRFSIHLMNPFRACIGKLQTAFLIHSSHVTFTTLSLGRYFQCFPFPHKQKSNFHQSFDIFQKDLERFVLNQLEILEITFDTMGMNFYLKCINWKLKHSCTLLLRVLRV